nr:hypothetical protein [Tanacetum cinerariifolium]
RCDYHDAAGHGLCLLPDGAVEGCTHCGHRHRPIVLHRPSVRIDIRLLHGVAAPVGELFPGAGAGRDRQSPDHETVRTGRKR